MLSLKKHPLLLLVMLFACTFNLPLKAQGQTTLAAGDIIFTGYNSIPGTTANADVIAFVLLKNITSGTQISFTDRGFFGGTSWQPVASTEGTIRWTAGSALTVGTQVIITGLTSEVYNPDNNTSAVNGTVEKTEHFNTTLNNASTGLLLSAPGGDQIIAFQSTGTDVSASGVTLIAGLHFFLCAGGTTDANWDGPSCANGPSKSAMPPGLSDGFSAFRAVPPSSNSAYSGRFNNCAGGPFTTAAQIRTAVMNRNNWTFDNNGTGLTIPANCDLSVGDTNAAPVVTTSTGTTSFTEGTAVVIDNAITVTDADNTTLTSATVTISGNLQSSGDRLLFSNQSSITGSYDASSGTLTLTGNASLAAYQTALRSIRYNNISGAPSTANRTISFLVNDGTANSTTATKTLSVEAVNNNPTVSGLPSTLTFTEDATTSGLDLTGIAIADPDIGAGNITIVFKASTGIFDIASGTGITASGHLTNELTLTGKLSDINTYLNIPTNIYYRPAANLNGTNAATVTVTANDNGNTGTGGGTTVTLGTISIDITAVNDAPVAEDDNYTLYVNTPKTGNILSNDTDVENNTLTASLVTAPVNGTVVLNADGSFTYTPNANFTGSDTFNYQVCDNGAPSLCDTGKVNFTINAMPAPTVSSVTVPANGTYRLGQTLSLTVNFSNSVTITGTPQLSLTIGSTNRTANYSSGSGSPAITFTYTVANGDLDMDGITIGSLSLNGGTIRDASATNAVLTLNNVASTVGILVNGIAPTVSSINIVSTEISNATSVEYTVTFSESVSGVDASDFVLTGTGSASGSNLAVVGSGTTYTVTVSGITGDGTLRLDLRSSGTGIANSEGNAIAGGYTSGQRYTFDHTAPAIMSVGVPVDATYIIGSQLEFTINFNESVTVNTIGGTPSISVTVGNTVHNAYYTSGSGSSALVFRYTVTAGDADNDGISIGSSLTLNGGTIKDAVGNNSNLSLNSVGSTANVLVDGITPKVAITSNTSTLKKDETATITFTFTEQVTGFSLADVLISGGTLSGLTATNPGKTWTATFTPATDVNSGAASISIGAASYKDLAGNNGEAGVTPSLTYDTKTPSVTISSSTGASGSNISTSPMFTITFSENVDALVQGDLNIVNASVSNFSGSGSTYTFNALPTTNGLVSVNVGANVVADAAGNGNTASNIYSFNYTSPDPSITVGTVTAPSGTYGSPSAATSISVNSANLTSDILVTAPTNFQVSSDNITFATTTTLVRNGARTLYLRLAGNAPAGIRSGTITFSNAQLSDVTVATGPSTVTAKALTITANNANKTYGETLTGGTGSTAFTASGLENNETVGSVSIAYGTGAAADANVGTYTAQVTPSAATGGTFTAANYSITYNNADIIVGTKSLTITANNANKTYGETLTGGAGSTAFTASGLENNETIGSVSIAYGTSAAANANVGTYTAQVTPSGAIGGTFTEANYSITYKNADIIVGTKSLTITANNANKTYGETLTGGTGSTAFTASGLENNETIGSVSIAYGTGAAANANVGTYSAQVTPSAAIGGTFTAANYSITYKNADIIIGTKALTITANNASKTYGETLTGGTGSTAFTASGLENNETIGSVSIAYGTGAAADANVGTYTAQVTPSAATGGTFTAANYSITYNNADIVVGTKALTITANNANKTYGETLTGGTGSTAFTASGLENNETIGSVSIAYGTGAAADANVGTYIDQVTPSAAIGGTFTAANYSITYNNADIIIGTKALTITANNANKTYGETLTGGAGSTAFTASGLENNETIGSVSIAYGTGAAADANVGTYTDQVTPSAATGGTFTAANYSITYNAGNIIAGTKVLTISAENKTKTYGEANPVLTASYNGFVNNDDANSLTTPPSLSTTATQNSSVGNYEINVLGAASSNYSITYVAGNLLINPKTINVTAIGQVKTYGNADPVLSYNVSPSLQANDSFSGTLDRAPGEDVGTYAINQGSLALSNNYILSFTTADLVIEKAVLTITANNATICQGNSLPSFGVDYSGFKLNDGETSLSTKPVVSTTATRNSQAGEYTLRPEGAAANNYTFVYVNGTLTINALPVVNIISNKGTSISKGETVVLSASSNDGVSYSWSNVAGIISGTQTAELTVRPLETTTYTVTVTNANGCQTTTNFTIQVNEDFMALKAENFMTPNGDGINDTWVVHNIDAYPNHSLKIVDRAGRIVYEARNYKNDWDGTFKGAPLQQGTYYYIFQFGIKNAVPKKGFITIVRSEQ
jgi:gliding motility-associated-like protein